MSKYSFGAVIILIAASSIAIASVWRDSPIVDEVPHIGSGYSYVTSHTYQFNPEHPPLAKDLAGLALLALHIPSDTLSTYTATHPKAVNDQWNFGRSLIYHSGIDPIAIIHLAKLSQILFFIFSGWLIYAWAHGTYNSRAALLAVFLFALCPTVIAHSRFVTTDVPALFGVLLASYFFLKYLREQSVGWRNPNFWLSAVSFGVALLTKFSTFLLIPYFLILAIVWAWTQNDRYLRPTIRIVSKTILIMLVGFIVIVGPIYQLHVFKYPPAQQKTDTASILAYYPTPIVTKALTWASDKPVLRTYAQWGLGMAMVFQRAEGGNRTYFFGELSNKSFKSYFPIVYVLKEPIPFLALLLCGIWLGCKSWRATHLPFKNKIREYFPGFAMLLWILIYMAASIKSNLNIGIRHLMPIYGFVFILVAGQIERTIQKQGTVNSEHKTLNKKHTLWSLFIVLLLFWYLAEFISVYPYYLTSFNEFAGGPSGGHKYVVDSNLDWGQDLWRLGDFIDKNNIQKIYLDYFGWAEQSFYLGDSFRWMHAGEFTSAEQFLAENPSGGWLAVSASYYQESTTDPAKPYAWLGNIEPKAVIGNSIFVWYIAP